MTEIKVGDRIRIPAEHVVASITYNGSLAVKAGERTGAGYNYFRPDEVELIQPTTLEQFLAFPIGTVFRNEYDDEWVRNRIKVGPEQYVYEYSANASNIHHNAVAATHAWNTRNRLDKLIVVTPS